MSINRGEDKEGVVHIEMEYYSAIKRKEIMAIGWTWMDLEVIMLSKVSQTVRHQPQMLSLTCEIQKQKKIK